MIKRYIINNISLSFSYNDLDNVENSVDSLESQFSSFNSAKSTIVNSALGKTLGLTESSTIESVSNSINTVADRGAWSYIITTEGGSITIPKGYHNGNGKVQVSGLVIAATSLSGTTTCICTLNNTTVRTTINFSKPFATTPTVRMTASFSDMNYIESYAPESISRTGFVARVTSAMASVPDYRNTKFTVTITWNAYV